MSSTRGAAPSPQLERLFSGARWLVSVAAVGAGVFSLDRESSLWAAVTIVLYAAPLLAQAGPPSVRVAAAWLAVFLVGQTAISAALNRTEFITLPPNMRTQVDIRGGFVGISGLQEVTTDERGFRVTPRINYRDKRGYRVVAIGGSTTEQIYIDDRRTWPYLVQQSLASRWRQTVEVINAGVSGLRTPHHVETLRRVEDADPDLALFLIGINDWNHHIVHAMEARGLPRTVLDPESEHRWRFFRNSLLGKALTFARRRPQPAPSGKRLEDGAYYTPWRNSLARRPTVSFRPDAVDGVYADALLALADECRRQQIACMLITQPTAYQPEAPAEVKAAFWMTPPNQSYTLDFESMVAIADLYNAHLRHTAAEQQLYLCDAAAQIAPSFDNFYDDCHLNLGGARRLASIVEACVAALPDRGRAAPPR
jgi:hypothetical protein